MPLTYSISGQTMLPEGCMGLQPSSIKGYTAAGCDIRPDSWDLIIGKPVFTAKGNKVTKAVFIGKVRDEDEVEFVMRQYRVRVAVADCRPEATLAKRLQERMRRYGVSFWRAEYNTSPSSIEMKINEAEGLIKLDKTITLDRVQYAFATSTTVAIPQNYIAVSQGAFSREMKGANRQLKQWMGRDVYVWEPLGDDHAMHAWNYLSVAVTVGKMFDIDSELLEGAVPGYSSLNPPKKREERPVKVKVHPRVVPWSEIERKDSEGML